MTSSTSYQRRTFALFFIVSLVPALVVAAVWFGLLQAQQADEQAVTLHSIIIPVVLIGLLPALGLSYVFAALLTRPVKRLHQATLELARGNFNAKFDALGSGEFQETGAALAAVASKLQASLSEASSELSLIEAERNKLRGVLDSMVDGVFALDRQGRIMLFNQAATRLTGRPITEVAGQLAEKVMPFRRNGELVMARWLATHQGTQDKVGEWQGLELYRGDGTSLYVDVRALVLSDDPNGIRALVTFHDLTDEHRLEEMKVDFVALAAHELRTPITQLKGYLDILQHEATGLRKDDRLTLDQCAVSAAELGGLVNNLLNAARIEHGEMSYMPEQTNYRDFVQGLLPGFETLLQARGLELRTKLPKSLPNINLDPVGIREVLNNLVTNAGEHTPAGGWVELQVKLGHGDISTIVIDSGTGMPQQALPRLFTKFYRINEFAASTRGTGLGLYISKAIVDVHGGHIWAESEMGHGSRFGFELPIATTIAPALDTSDNTTITRGPHGWIKNHTHR